MQAQQTQASALPRTRFCKKNRQFIYRQSWPEARDRTARYLRISRPFTEQATLIIALWRTRVALLLAAALMLEHVNHAELAGRLRTAVLQTLQQDGVRTRDLGGTASTKDFAAAIVRRLRS